MYSGRQRHDEFTLGQRQRQARREWFGRNINNRALSI
jgi:hypothetical protein